MGNSWQYDPHAETILQNNDRNFQKAELKLRVFQVSQD